MAFRLVSFILRTSHSKRITQQDIYTLLSVELHHCPLLQLRKFGVQYSKTLSIHQRCFTSTKSYYQESTSETVLKEITHAVKEVQLDSLVYKRSEFKETIEQMLEYGFKTDQIKEVFLENPYLLNCQYEDVISVLKPFIDYGFTPPEISSILKELPDIVENPKEISAIFSFFESVGLHGRTLRKIVSDCPAIVFENPSQLGKRYQALIGIFRKSDLVHMLRKNGNILTEDIKTIEKKVNYVYHAMGLDQTEMVWSNLLRYGFDLIRTRHILLSRTGKFERPDKKGGTSIVNPYLKDILSATDEKFARDMANVSLKEYLTFTKMLDYEQSIKEEEFQSRFDSDDEDNLDGAQDAKGYKKEIVKKERMRKQILDFELK